MPLAQQGKCDAQLTLAGVLLNQGHAAEAARWLQRAAVQGSPEAQRRLARLYAQGRGVTRDDKRAFKWEMKAAQQGDALAQNNVGAAYSHGRGVPVSASNAVEWYARAARQGYALAQFNLAGAYLSGTGTPMNAGVAYAWYATVLAQADGPLKQAAGTLQQQAQVQVQRTGRIEAAQALAASYLQRYTRSTS
ncbi:TPA: tetratricopeptide repeat protein [Yersinia enterocolitica]